MSQYDEYVAYWKKRLKQESDIRSHRSRKAKEAAEICVQVLADKYHIKRAYLFGSSAGWSRFHERSDIDLAVEGLPVDSYFKALSELDKHLPAGMELDLVPLEDAYPELKDRILKEGILLYERQAISSTSG